MRKKNLIFLGIILAVILLFVATIHYPGGSQSDAQSIGFDWVNNYLSNLFSSIAVNGADNAARPWAMAGMFFLCLSFGAFFIDFSNKITAVTAALIVKYCGVGAMFFAFLTITPLHDLMILVASILVLLSCFYITVFVLKSKLFLLKVLSVVFLLICYLSIYVYFSRSFLAYLPMLQKITLLLSQIWVLGLVYFTTKEDFQHIK